MHSYFVCDPLTRLRLGLEVLYPVNRLRTVCFTNFNGVGEAVVLG